MAGLSPANLVNPVVVVVLATQEPLNPPEKKEDLPNIEGYLTAPLMLYSAIYPSTHIRGEVYREVLSLYRKLYLLAWGEGLNIPPLKVNCTLSTPQEYTAWCIANKLRDEYLRVYNYHFPHLGLLRNKGHLKRSSLQRLKILPPFMIYERLPKAIRDVPRGRPAPGYVPDQT